MSSAATVNSDDDDDDDDDIYIVIIVYDIFLLAAAPRVNQITPQHGSAYGGLLLTVYGSGKWHSQVCMAN